MDECEWWMLTSHLHAEKQSHERENDPLVAVGSVTGSIRIGQALTFFGPLRPLDLMLPPNHPDNTYLILDFMVHKAQWFAFALMFVG